MSSIIDGSPRQLAIVPAKITAFHLFLVLLTGTLLLPPIVRGSSLRLDTTIVFIAVPILTLQLSVIHMDRRVARLVRAHFVLFGGVALALVFQLFFIARFDFRYVINLQGYSRPLFFVLLAAMVTTDAAKSRAVASMILFGIVLHGALVVLLAVDFGPVVSAVSMFYWSEQVRSFRATGLFDRVHALAYFGVYGLLFAIGINLLTVREDRLHRLSTAAIAFSLVNVVLPFSRGAWLAAAVSLVYIFARPRFFKSMFLGCIIAVCVSWLLFRSIPDLSVLTLAHVDSVVEGLRFFFSPSLIEENASLRFITGRLDWGWRHAIGVWQTSPLVGDLSASFSQFIGDGGYTEALANHGLVGLFAMLAYWAFLWFASDHKYWDNGERSKTVVFRGYVITFVIGSLATGFLKERTIELLPVMFVTLMMFPTANQAKRRVGSAVRRTA